MSSRELQASLSLAAIFGLRLFGMFIILPVFALWATIVVVVLPPVFAYR